VRAELNEGTFAGAASPCAPHAAATAIKIFFRELPQPLLSAIPTETLLQCASEAECGAAVEKYLSPHAYVLLQWLVDLARKVAAHEAENKMNAKALAICLGPNLFIADEKWVIFVLFCRL
jgi:hypothetical protein